MKDSALRLQDKTILLVGPFNGVTQACMRTLTEFGCDVAFVSDQTPNASRYVDGINEAREVHSNYGRAGFFNMPLKTESQVMEALGRVTESLGRVDALVDATPMAWDGSTQGTAIDICVLLAEKCLPFLLAKHRGRIVYLFEDTSLEEIVPTTNTSGFRDTLNEKIVELAKQYAQKNVTVNGLSVGLTDDFILKTYPKNPSIKKSIEELQKTFPSARLVETHDVALGVAYLASALSGSVTGQVLRLTQGFHL